MINIPATATKVITGLGIATLIGIGVYSNVSIASQAEHEIAIDEAMTEVLETAQGYHMGETKGKVATDAATEWNKTDSPITVSVETSKQFVIVQAAGYGMTGLKTDAIIEEGGIQGKSTESRIAQMKAERNLELNSSKEDDKGEEKSESLIEQNAPEARASQIEEAAGAN